MKHRGEPRARPANAAAPTTRARPGTRRNRSCHAAGTSRTQSPVPAAKTKKAATNAARWRRRTYARRANVVTMYSGIQTSRSPPTRPQRESCRSASVPTSSAVRLGADRVPDVVLPRERVPRPSCGTPPGLRPRGTGRSLPPGPGMPAVSTGSGRREHEHGDRHPRDVLDRLRCGGPLQRAARWPRIRSPRSAPRSTGKPRDPLT